MIDIETFNDKKVLLVCAETFSWPMHYVAENIRQHCKSLSAIFIQPGESYFDAPDITEFRRLNEDIRKSSSLLISNVLAGLPDSI